MKDIVIIANFCSLISDSNDRFREIAEKLSVSESVEVITSSFSHLTKGKKDLTSIDVPFEYTIINEPGYSRNICLKRFYSHFIWGINVKKYLKKRKRPDVVYCAMPSLTASFLTAGFCRKNDVKYIIDIQDLWPEAFKMVFNAPVIGDIVYAPFNFIANGSYRCADEICAVSSTYLERAISVNKKCNSGHVVFLGTHLERFDKYVKENAINNKPDDELWLGYCGTLGASYDLISVFDALILLKERGIKSPKFIIMGDGLFREKFETYAKKNHLAVEFTGNLPYPQMCGKLAVCDIVVNPIKKGSAGSIINKHADYAASGLPVLNTQESDEYRLLVDEYHMGFNCKNGDASDLAEKLVALMKDEELREKMGNNARLCAEEKFDRKISYEEIVKCVKE